MGLVQKPVSFCPVLDRGFREGHITQQSLITNSLGILVGYKKLICVFLTCGFAGEVAHLCIRFQVRFRSTCLHPRLLRCLELALLMPLPKGQLPTHPIGAHLKALLMSRALISHRASKSHGQEQSLWDKDIALFLLQGSIQRPHDRGKGLG